MDLEVQIESCLLISLFAIVPMVTIIIFSKKWILRQREKATYIIEAPTWFTRLMVAGGLFSYIVALIGVFLDEIDIVVMVVIFSFIFMTDIGCFMSLFWVIVVHEQEGFMIYYRPPFLAKKIYFSDITKVEYLENRMLDTFPVKWWNTKWILRVYQYSEKLFEIDDTMPGYENLRKYFEALEFWKKQAEFETGRSTAYEFQIEPGLMKPGVVEKAELKDDFSLGEKNSEKLGNGIMAVFFTGVIIASVFSWEEWAEGDSNYVYYFLLMIPSAVLFLCVFIQQLLTKISVYDHKIYVRNGIGQVKVYTMRDISRIVEEEHYIVLYFGKKKAVKVYKDYKNYASFAAWIGRELGELSEESERKI